jgi:septal ring factor EnvC (AmiA/AmiB activator)
MKGELNMEDIEVKLARFEQRVETLERDVVVIKDIQTEIRTISETLVTLASEIKHTNEHLAKQEHKIDVIEQQPRQRLQQIVTAIIAALAGGLISSVIAFIIK